MLSPFELIKMLGLSWSFIRMARERGYRNKEQLIILISKVMMFEHENEESRIIWKQAKISELQSQINPHFLYNTLESLRGQALDEGHPKIAEMTEALAKYFRYSINKENDIVTLEEEIENIKNYIHIQKYRFEDRFEFKWFVENSEDLQYRLPKMTLQPIVENAIYHGMESRLSDGRILLRVQSSPNKVFVFIQDNGQGMNEEELANMHKRLRSNEGILESSELKKHMGIAMINVEQRLRLLFGEPYGLQINSAVGVGTEVLVTLPKETEY